MNFGFANPFRNAQPAAPTLSLADVIKMAAAGEITVLDVRDHNELAQTGKAKGALHIPLFQLSQQGDPRHPEFNKRLNPQKPVAIYCASGARSEMARRTLVSYGFAEVYNIGGYNNWRAAGGAWQR